MPRLSWPDRIVLILMLLSCVWGLMTLSGCTVNVIVPPVVAQAGPRGSATTPQRVNPCRMVNCNSPTTHIA